jgi:hypothetical protein
VAVSASVGVVQVRVVLDGARIRAVGGLASLVTVVLAVFGQPLALATVTEYTPAVLTVAWLVAPMRVAPVLNV